MQRFFTNFILTITLVFVAGLFGGVSEVYGAFNKQINYQGKLTDTSAVAVTDGNYNMVFKLYTTASGGTAVWTESDTVAVQNGLFSVMLGSTTPLTSVDFNQTLYLGVTVGADSEMTPRKVIGAVPAAFEADNAATVGGVASSSLLRSDQADTATGEITFAGGFTATNGTTTNATSTNLFATLANFTTAVIDSITATIGQFTGLTATNATTTNLYSTNLDLGNALTVANGGTGASTLTGLLLGNGTSAFTATTTLSASYIQDAYLLNTGDTATGDYNFDSGTLFVDSVNNRVGIGTASPSANLDIYTASSDTQFRISRGSAFSYMQQNTSGGVLRLQDTNGTPGTLFRSYGDSWINGGNVGIGTTSPTAKLDVYGDINISDTAQGYKIGGNRILYASSTNFSVAVGQAAGLALLNSATFNTVVGAYAMENSTSTSNNVAIGSMALRNTSGGGNTAAGNSVLSSNTTGTSNSGFGFAALSSNTTGYSNSGFGVGALSSNTTGANNIGIGHHALYLNTVGDQNIGIGTNALLFNQTGYGNIAIGTSAGYGLNTATSTGNNTIIGFFTGWGLTTGVNNTIIGANVTGLSSSMSNNIILADGAGNQRINVDSAGNVGIGVTSPSYKLDVAGTINTTGTIATTTDKNVQNILLRENGTTVLTHQTAYWNGSAFVSTNGYGVGLNALANNTGNRSNGFGNVALQNNTGDYANGFGFNALGSNTGDSSNGFGYNVLLSNTGDYANGFGSSALQNNTGSGANGFGYQALQNNTGVYSNGIGSYALQNNTGSQANGFGRNTLSKNAGSNNTAIGHDAGYSSTYTLTGSSNTFLGANSTYSTASGTSTITNATAVGANVTLTNSNTVILGNGANVGIGTTSPSQSLEVNGKIVTTDAGGNSTGDLNVGSDGVYSWNGSSRYVRFNTSGTVNDLLSYGASLVINYSGGQNVSIGAGFNKPSKLSIIGNLAVGDTTFVSTAAPTGGATFQGNVGIGTTSPAAKLEISSTDNLLVLNRTGSEANIIFKNNSSAVAQIRGITGGGLKITDGSSSSNWLNITSTGNVGIGTTSPAYKLDVNGTSGFNGLLTMTGGNIALNGHYLSGDGGNEGITVDDSGNVKIAMPASADTSNNFLTVGGTGTPYSKNLSSSVVTGIKTNPVNTGTGSMVGLSAQPVTGATGTVASLVGVAGSVRVASAGSLTVTNGYALKADAPTMSAGSITNAYGLYIGTQLQTNVTNGYGVYQVGASDKNYFAGNVGIGTTSPSYKLDVNGTSGFNGLLTMTGGNIALNGHYLSGDGGNEGVYVDSSGNVGIGTASPSANLDIYTASSDTQFRISRGSAYSYIQQNTSGGVLRLQDTNGTIGTLFRSYGDSWINGGNVGIGTTSPAAKLDVWGNLRVGTSSTPALFVDTATGNVGLNKSDPGTNLSILPNAEGEGIEMFEADGGNLALSFYGYNGAGTMAAYDAGVTKFYVDPTWKMYYTGGNVGIGTTSPASKLDVWGDVRAGTSSLPTLLVSSALDQVGVGMDPSGTLSKLSIRGFSQTVGSGTRGAGVEFYSADGTGAGWIGTNGEASASNKMFYYSTRGAGGHIFATNGVPDGAMTIDNSGYVGIGTTSPTSLLHLATTGGSGADGFNISNAADERFMAYFNGSTADSDFYMNYLNSGGADIIVQSDGDVILASSGNVGIGDSAPAYKLEVAGDVNTTAGGYRDAGTCVAGTCASDINLKTNISSISNALTVVNALDPVSFEFIDSHYGSGTQYGFIAQELENVLPQFVSTSTDGYKQVQYGLQFEMYALAALKDITNIFDLSSASTTSAALTVASNGNIGIGTTTPTAQLHTTGSVRLENFGAGTLQTDANGNVMVSSDERLKNIVGTYDAGLDEILGITPIQYHWKESTGFDSEGTYTGFSAQNVRSVLPDAVGEDKNGFLTLDTRPILAAIVNAIQEIWQTVTGNQEKISDLEARVQALESQMGTSSTTNTTSSTTTGSTGNVTVVGGSTTTTTSTDTATSTTTASSTDSTAGAGTTTPTTDAGEDTTTSVTGETPTTTTPTDTDTTSGTDTPAPTSDTTTTDTSSTDTTTSPASDPATDAVPAV